MHVNVGFVDLQVNGFGGIDFSSPDLMRDDFLRACRTLFASGTAAFLPTVITSPAETYRRNLPLIAAAMKLPELRGRLLGIHLEGPFISPQPGAVGAHNPEWVLPPSIEFFDQLCDWADGAVRLLTIAADQPGAAELARHAVSRGVRVSLGHHLATDADLLRLADAGASALTHLGNGLPNMLPRLANPIWAGLAEDSLAAMIIADGHHLPRAALTAIVRAAGADRLIAVSDAAPLAGMPPGRYHTLGNDALLEPSGLLHNPAKGCLVGSSATIMQCMNHLASLKLLSPDELVLVGFHNPLRLIGVEAESIPATGGGVVWNEGEGRFRLRTEQ